MTAAALLVVLGALMQFAGMSMALGAFLAGVMLAGSNYRHEKPISSRFVAAAGVVPCDLPEPR